MVQHTQSDLILNNFTALRSFVENCFNKISFSKHLHVLIHSLNHAICIHQEEIILFKFNFCRVIFIWYYADTDSAFR